MLTINDPKIFIGWDSREEVPWNVCKFSIERRNKSGKWKIHPLKQNILRESGIYTRGIDILASTEFSLTRFLVPYLSDYKDFSIFVDCDFLFLNDIEELISSIDLKKAVSVVKHEYFPDSGFKMDGREQHIYPRKNWTSLMVFNNAHPSNLNLTPDLVNSQSPQYLHRLKWLSDDEIGEIHHEWNYLVGWYSDIQKPKAVHYTEGGPWFSEYLNCDFSKEWLYEYYLMTQKNLYE